MQSLHLRYSSPPARRHPPAALLRGFTAIELMVVIAILAVLAALAAPSFTPIVERWRVKQATEELQSSVYYARSEAIKRGGGITLVTSTNWDAWTVSLTQNGTTTDLQTMSAPNKVAISQSASKTTLYVDRWGMLSDSAGGTAQAMNFVLKPAGKADTDVSAIRLCIGVGGRLQQKSQGAACPP